MKKQIPRFSKKKKLHLCELKDFICYEDNNKLFLRIPEKDAVEIKYCPHCGIGFGRKKRKSKLKKAKYRYETPPQYIEFRPIPGYEETLVSPCGKIWSTISHGYKTIRNHKGYLCFYVSKRIFSVHRAIALAYVPGFEEGLHVDHVDGNKLNNSIENLEWVTPQENRQRAVDMGLIKGRKRSADPLYRSAF